MVDWAAERDMALCERDLRQRLNVLEAENRTLRRDRDTLAAASRLHAAERAHLERQLDDALAGYARLLPLRSLLAAAERLIIAHHEAGPQRKGAICRVCEGEHEVVNQIWRELHQLSEAKDEPA